jgi:hypothetical protein
MRRFAIVMTVLVLLTLIWLGVIMNVARFYLDFENETHLIFKNATLQFRVIYIFGIILFGSYAYVLVSQRFNNFF